MLFECVLLVFDMFDVVCVQCVICVEVGNVLVDFFMYWMFELLNWFMYVCYVDIVCCVYDYVIEYLEVFVDILSLCM